MHFLMSRQYGMQSCKIVLQIPLHENMQTAILCNLACITICKKVCNSSFIFFKEMRKKIKIVDLGFDFLLA